METLVIVGSTAATSTTARLAGHLVDRLEQREPDTTVTRLDRRLLRLPGLDADAFTRGDLALDPDVRELGTRLAAARAVVLLTPVQHGSYAGALKNLLDHAPRAALRDKPVLLAATGSTLHLGSSACDHLRAVARSLGGWTVPTQLIVERTELRTGPSPRLTARIDRALTELATATRLLTPTPA